MHSKRVRVILQAQDRQSITRCLVRGGYCFVAVEHTVRVLGIMQPSGRSAGRLPSAVNSLQYCDVHYREDPIHEWPLIDDLCHDDTIQRRIFGHQERDAAIDHFLRGLDPSCEIVAKVAAVESGDGFAGAG